MSASWCQNSFDMRGTTVKTGGRAELVDKRGHMVDAAVGRFYHSWATFPCLKRKKLHWRLLSTPVWLWQEFWLNTAAHQGSPWCGDNSQVSTQYCHQLTKLSVKQSDWFTLNLIDWKHPRYGEDRVKWSFRLESIMNGSHTFQANAKIEKWVISHCAKVLVPHQHPGSLETLHFMSTLRFSLPLTKMFPLSLLTVDGSRRIWNPVKARR